MVANQLAHVKPPRSVAVVSDVMPPVRSAEDANVLRTASARSTAVAVRGPAPIEASVAL